MINEVIYNVLKKYMSMRNVQIFTQKIEEVSWMDGQPFTQYPEAIGPLLNTYMVIIDFIGLWNCFSVTLGSNDNNMDV